MIRFKQILSLVLSFVALSVYAQTQRGLVRTAGTSTHRGVPVSGAVVKVKGNYQQVLSGSKGEFSVPMPGVRNGESYQLLNVTKKGYEFADKDFLSRRFAYSDKSILEIVLLSSAELQEEKQEIEEKVLKVIKENYTKKLNALKQDKEKGKISIEEYRNRYKVLQDQYDTFDEVIADLAEHYARTDYDLLDSLDVQINTCIINGELDNADLLLAQKGNLDDRIAAYQRHAATNAAAREKLAKLSEELQEQRNAYEKERDDISNDLYNKHSIAISRFDFDKALEMLKLRADLDTTNVDAVWDYAYFCDEQKKFNDCETYYHICLRACINDENIHNIATIQNNLGALHRDLHDYTSSEKYLKLALENKEHLFAQNPDAYRADLAGTQDNLGSLYYYLHDYTNSQKYYKLALENREYLFTQNPDAYRADLANTQNNLGLLYNNLHNYTNSEKYFKLALDNREQLFAQNPDAFRADLAVTQNNLGLLHNNLHDYTNSEKYYKLALENYEQLFAQNPDAFRADLARTQNNLGSLYSDIHDYTNGEKYYKLALKNREKLFAQNPDAYRTDLAITQLTLGSLYCYLHDYINSEKYYKLALEKYGQLFAQNPDAFRAYLAMTQNNLGNLYSELHDYTNSEKYSKLALENIEQLFAQNPDAFRADLARTQNNLGSLYLYLQDYTNSEKYYKQALENYKQLFAQNPDAFLADLARTQNNLGSLYLYLHDYTSSEKYYKQALENREHLFAQNPDAYRADLAITYWNMMLLYEETENIEQYDQYLECALKLYKELYSSQPSIYVNYLIELQNRKVWRMLMNGKIDEAIVLVKKTIAMDESNETSKEYLAECYNGKAYEYAKASDYVNAHTSIDKAISMFPDNANFYDSKGEIYLMQGKNTEALEIWKKVIELNPNFLDDDPEGTNLSNGLKKLGLIE